ncbi:MAG: hypothetical protein DHS20C12_30270 [Pseudohongiella sp.]|nr:MAG: hypothetical protein DHS20C12_30270 [Pseudohongiella sp.]
MTASFAVCTVLFQLVQNNYAKGVKVISSIKLKLAIKTNDPRPIFRQIVDGIGMGIATGALQPGAKLPSVRALAIQLAINPNTVAKAYTELTNRNLVDARAGLGLYVSKPKQTLSRAERKARLNDAMQRMLNEVVHLQLSDEEIVATLQNSLLKFRKLERAGGSDV